MIYTWYDSCGATKYQFFSRLAIVATNLKIRNLVKDRMSMGCGWPR